jgi:hypothetical protein
MFTLKIRTDNEAFTNNLEGEIIRLMYRVARKVDEGCTRGDVQDENGNTVGDWRLTKPRGKR